MHLSEMRADNYNYKLFTFFLESAHAKQYFRVISTLETLTIALKTHTPSYIITTPLCV